MENDLNPNDLKARVIGHFRDPMPVAAREGATLVDLCQSGFEREVYLTLVERGYHVAPQVGSQGFAIDMVVEGESGRRLAVECDGDRYHGPERWADDMRRQRILERVGWTFWRCFGSNYSLDRDGVLAGLFQTLDGMGIRPIGNMPSISRYTQHRTATGRRDEADRPGGSAAPDSQANAWQSDAAAPVSSSNSDDDTRLAVGDRIVIRYLDDPKSKPEFYHLTDRASDLLNGLLSVSSSLARELSEASPGDEISVRVDDRDRTLLFMTLEREQRQGASGVLQLGGT